MNILKIDTGQMGKVRVSLQAGEKELVKEKEQMFGSQVLLNMIEEILKKARLKMEDLDSIEANTGPGSFTGIRVGVSVANALGFSLGIQVNGKKREIELKYL